MLLKLKLIKTKTYLKKESFPSLKIEDVECRLKKGLQIISKYHASGKKILFAGSLSPAEETIVKKSLKNTIHAFIPEHWRSNGSILNNQSSQVHPSKNRLSHKTSWLKNHSHLTLVLNDLASDFIMENYKAKIPTIALSNNLNIFDFTFSYKVLGNFISSQRIVKSNLFLMLLQSFLRKPIDVLVLMEKLRRFNYKFRKL
jgi:hypothetical protein